MDTENGTSPEGERPLLGVPPWGYAAGRPSGPAADGTEFGWSPPTPLLTTVDPTQYAALEQPGEKWDAIGLPRDFPLRVAETIADVALAGHLLDRARHEDREVRRLAIFTLGWIARHFADVSSGEFPRSGQENGWPQGRPDRDTALRVAHDLAAALVDLAAAEQDRFLAMNALDPLAHLPGELQLTGSALPQLMRHRSWQVRNPALAAAHLCPPDEVEPALLAAAADSSQYTRGHAAAQLRRCAGAQARDALVGLLADTKGEVRATALDSLVTLDAAGALPYVREAATSWPAQARYFATGHLAELGDEQDVALLAERVHRLLSRRRAIESIPSELTHLLPFLDRHRSDPQAQRALAYVTKRWSSLFDREQRWLAEALPALVPRGVSVPPPEHKVVRSPRCPTDLDALVAALAPERRRAWWRRGVRALDP